MTYVFLLIGYFMGRVYEVLIPSDHPVPAYNILGIAGESAILGLVLYFFVKQGWVPLDL